MRGSIAGVELHEQFIRTTGKVNIHLNKLSGITTDAAAAMVGKKDGLTGLIMEKVHQRKARASEFTLC